MIYGHKNREVYELPEWAGHLTNLYWVIRVENKDSAKRRKYYRLVAKEKLRLAEMDIQQELIEAVCYYLVKMTVVSGRKMRDIMSCPKVQLTFKFCQTNENNIAV